MSSAIERDAWWRATNDEARGSSFSNSPFSLQQTSSAAQRLASERRQPLELSQVNVGMQSSPELPRQNTRARKSRFVELPDSSLHDSSAYSVGDEPQLPRNDDRPSGDLSAAVDVRDTANPIEDTGESTSSKTLSRPSGDASKDKSFFSNGQEGGLTEVTAPAPIQERDASGEWQHEENLEGAELEAQRMRDNGASQEQQLSKALTQLYTMSYLIFFAIWGTLARLGVQWLTFYPGAPVTISNLWANFGGTLLMGFVVEDQSLFREEWGKPKYEPNTPRPLYEKNDNRSRTAQAKTAHGKVKKTIPLFIGLTTGFCGSFTSFSTFMRDVFYALSDEIPDPNEQFSAQTAVAINQVRHNGGYSFEAILAIVIMTVGLSLFALNVGAQMAIGLDRVTPTLPFRIVRRYIDPLFVVLGFGCWLGAVFMSIWPPDRQGGITATASSPDSWRGEALFACVFAPIGCLLRYYLSLKLNAIVPWFPLGTYIVNMFGTAVLSMCFDIQHVTVDLSPLVGGGHIGCQVLQGIEDGFCGALTTVSTWINEIDSLKRRHGWFYALTSILSGLALVVVILGSVAWTVGFSDPSCTTGRG